MISKQLPMRRVKLCRTQSWGCSNGLLVLVLIPTCLYTMESYKQYEESLPSDIIEQRMERPRSLTEEEKKAYRFQGTTWKQMMEAYRGAPWEVHQIVEHLNNPDLFGDDDYRAVFFVGQSGSGKTTTAKAVPHMANWFCKFITSSETEGIHRNETSNNLRNTLSTIANDRYHKVVVVIDEAEELFEDFESDKFDTKATGTAFRTIIDKLSGNRNIFLICTLNRDTKIPKTIKNRFEGSRIVFNPITDPVRKCTIFRDVLQSTNMTLDTTCDNAFLDNCVELLKDVPLRSYHNVRKKVSRLVWHDNPKSRVIGKKQLWEAAHLILADREQMETNHIEETSQEIQERHHKENLRKQDQLHVQNAMSALYKETSTTTEYEYGHNNQIKSTFQSFDKRIFPHIFSTFTPEQIKEFTELKQRQVTTGSTWAEYFDSIQEKDKQSKNSGSNCSIQ